MNKEEIVVIIFGKIFEYLCFKCFIFVIGLEKSDVEGILKEMEVGEYFIYNDGVILK